MKKINYLMLGLAAFALASCSQEDMPSVAPVAKGNYTVKVELPGELGTRALFGEGYRADQLRYFVYECDANGIVTSTNPIVEGSTTFPVGSLQTEVSFNLANGKYYQMAFFAASSLAFSQEVYVIDPSAKTITANYEKMIYGTNTVDGYDCFYRLYPTGQIGDAMTNNSPTVYLYRPVAQINWGTNDYGLLAVTDANAFGPDPQNTITTTFTADVFTKFNMLTSTVDGSSLKRDVTIPAMKVPQMEGVTFPIADYKYVAMQYLFAPRNTPDNTTEGGWLYDVNINVRSGVSDHNIAVAVDNCPLQANWRTNIYGALLTDNYSVKIVKEPAFDGQYNETYQ